MLLNRTVAPTTEIVSLADVKEHLRVDAVDDDFYISGLISAATVAVEEMTGRCVMPQTWAMSIDGASGQVFLPKSPVQSVSSIAYFDRDGASQTATVSDFHLFKDEDKAWLEPKNGFAWPATISRADALTITFVAGYAEVPPALRGAALLIIGHWYEHREAVGDTMTELPLALQSLVNLHRTGWIAA